MLANGCRSPKYLLLRKPNIWPRKHSSCRFSVSSCSLSIDVDNIIVSSQFLLEVIFSPSSSILTWSSILLLHRCAHGAIPPSHPLHVSRSDPPPLTPACQCCHFVHTADPIACTRTVACCWKPVIDHHAHLCVNRRLCNPPRNPALIIFASIDA